MHVKLKKLVQWLEIQGMTSEGLGFDSYLPYSISPHWAPMGKLPNIFKLKFSYFQYIGSDNTYLRGIRRMK